MRFDLAPAIGILLIFVLLGPAVAQAPRPMNPPALPPFTHPAGIANEASRSSFPSSAPLSTSTWTAIGPAALDQHVFGTGNASGRITGVAVDPTTTPNTIYVAAAGGGVWKSTDDGTTWNPLTDNQSTLAMGAIAIAPSNHLKIYAGTGEANNSVDSNFGRGILVSSDGGATWTLSTGPSGAFDRLAIAHISVDPAKPDIAYAAVNDHAENGLRFANTGIYKTTDGGSTWTNMTSLLLDSSRPWSDVVVDPNNSAIIYAAHGDSFGGAPANGVYRSTDSGNNWVPLVGGPPVGTNFGRIALAVAPSASTTGKHVLYVAIAQPSGSGNGGLLQMLRSDNADATTPTFTNLSSTPDFLGGGNGSGQGWYDIVIGVDPSNLSNAYAAGVVTYGNPDTLGVIRSIDGGAHWTDITIAGGVQSHTDSHAMAFDSNNRLLLGTDGGLWRFDPTGSTSWTNLNGNLNTIQFYGIGLHPTSTTIALGGSQDNGTELYSGAAVWSETEGGDGAFAQISQTNPMRMYASHPIGSFGQTNFFHRSDDGGHTWTANITPSTIPNQNNWNFVVPFVVDPTNGDHVILDGDQVYETTNGGTSWSVIGTPGIGGFNPIGNPVDSAAIVPGTNTIYVATGGTFATTSQIFATTNDGGSWIEHDLPVIGRVNELDVDPNDATGQTVYAVINQFNGGNGVVYKTTNGGTGWTNISGNLPQVPAWSLKVDTDSLHTVYVSNELGVYASRSPYANWTPYGTGLPHAQAVDLELVGRQTPHLLGVATHGRGAWLIQIADQAAGATLSMTSAAFGSLDVGNASATTNVQLTSTGTAALNVGSITLSGTNPDQFALVAPTSGSPACAFGASSIAAGTSCFFGMQAKPNASGALSANVSVIDDAIGSPQNVALTATGADIAVSGPPAAVIVPAGQSASFTINLAAAGVPTLNVTTFSATGNPAATTITFNPVSIPAGSSTASTNMTIATTARSSSFPLQAPRSGPRLPLAPYCITWFVILLTALLLSSQRIRQGRLLGASLLVLATLTFAAVAGCSGGGGGGGSGGTTGTPAGTSTITVTATSGSLSRTTTVTLTVQ